MIDRILDSYRQSLGRYSPELLGSVVDRASRSSRAKRSDDPVEQLTKLLSQPKVVQKMIEKVGDGAVRTIGCLRRFPFLSWRWDHALVILESVGVESAYTVLKELLELGIIVMKRPWTDDPVVRFDVFTGSPSAALPHITLAGPLYASGEFEVLESSLAVATPRGSFRRADGWEWPMRLAILWQTTWLAPIKRTQQKVLFKRDRERLTLHPILASDTLDSLTKIPEPGVLIYHLALEQGWLDPQAEEQSPARPLHEIWPSTLEEVLLAIARGVVSIEDWNELGPTAPVGRFAADVVTSRLFILLWLSLLPPGEATSLAAIVDRLEATVAPWNGEGELTGPLRAPAERMSLCRSWVRGFVLGNLYQVGLVEVADNDAHGDSVDDGTPIVRLSPLGRLFLGLSTEAEIAPTYPQSLLVQPNHQIILYRQALSVEVLTKIVLFAEARTVGAALTFEVTPASVYHGLESGFETEAIIALLTNQSGRSLPGGVEESIRTWSQKRDRLAIYPQATLFEFTTTQDMEDALARGLVASRISDRMVLVEEQEGAFKNLRLSATRDYRLEPQPCVQCSPDGTLLTVNLETSDLMLESEIRRFSDLVSAADRSGSYVFRVTKDSIERAFDQGLRSEFFDHWFRRRTGHEPPESVKLLLRAVSGLAISARPILVVTVESPLVADGLMQHPSTAPLFAERLGPSALSIPLDRLESLRGVLTELGITLHESQDLLAVERADSGDLRPTGLPTLG